jgi:purine-binding chemotaxis protein CheW
MLMEGNYPMQIAASSQRHGEMIQLVSFLHDNEEYGVEVLRVREIIRIPSITKMPNSPHFVEGIFNLRGRVIPVISLRKRFGLPDIEKTNRTHVQCCRANTMSGSVLPSLQ